MSDDERGPEPLRPAEGREVELKLAVPRGELAALKRHPLVRSLAAGRPRVQRLHTVYYDTEDLDLERARLALRVRRAGRSHVQTLKGEGSSLGGLFVRGEWEAPLPGREPDVERIPSLSARSLARRAIGGKPLHPVFETDFRRTRFRLLRGETELLLDFDEGEIRAHGRSLPIRELELELARGDPGVLHGIALELHETVPLRPAIASKAERGYNLALGTHPLPRRAARVELAPSSTLEDAIAAVVAACLEQALANFEPAHEGSDPEGVHQLRVALRRTRAALRLFRDALPPEPMESFLGELRWLAGELGPARDLDVFLLERLEPLVGRFPGDPSLKHLRDAARELRERAYDQVRAALDAPRTSELTLALGGWLVARAWRDAPDPTAAARLAAPAAAAGAELLERRLTRARKRGRHLARRTPEERHRLRIELKKLRYAGEFLESLYPAADPARLLRRLADLQDTLGALNDVAMAEGLLERIAGHLGREWTPRHERAAGFVTGWIQRDSEQRLERLEKEWRRLRRAKPFWR
jgi:inorganic triphosphatase YgiF